MPNAIDGLKPAGLWKYFAEISKIPRPSKHEAAVGGVRRRHGQETRPRVRPGRGGHGGRAEARVEGVREPADGVPAGPPRHGSREAPRQEARLPQGPDHARPQGQHDDGGRHDARRRQRRRRGDEPGHHGRRLARARPARVPLHDRRGDRPHRRAQPAARVPEEQDPAEPGLRGRGRPVCRVLGRARHDGHLAARDRSRAGRHRGPRDQGGRPARRPLGPRDRQGPRQRDQDPQPGAARPRAARRPPRPHRRRQQAQRHPARRGGAGLHPEEAPRRGQGRRGRDAPDVPRRAVGVGRPVAGDHRGAVQGPLQGPQEGRAEEADAGARRAAARRRQDERRHPGPGRDLDEPRRDHDGQEGHRRVDEPAQFGGLGDRRDRPERPRRLRARAARR